MKLDPTFAKLLSNFCLDIAKAFFIATFITPSVSNISSFPEIVLILTRGIGSAILLLLFAWQFAKIGEKYE